MGALFSPEILQAEAVNRLSSWNGNLQILFIMTGGLTAWWFTLVYIPITEQITNTGNTKATITPNESETYKLILSIIIVLKLSNLWVGWWLAWHTCWSLTDSRLLASAIGKLIKWLMYDWLMGGAISWLIEWSITRRNAVWKLQYN